MMLETALAIFPGKPAVVALTTNRRRASTVFHEFRAYLSRGLQPVRSSGQAGACGSRCDDSRGSHETRYQRWSDRRLLAHRQP